MKYIGVTANCTKPRAPSVLKRLAEKAAELGIELFACEEACARAGGLRQVAPEALPDRIEALMALGGDGTMLHAARLLGGSDRPLIGVNIGSLGFMTSVADQDLEKALECLHADRFQISERTTADASLQRGAENLGSYRAVNDVVLGWGETSRVITLSLSINGNPVGTYVCDGLICSTPTGSTGHSLSAGGPILLPESPVFALNPICPHTLSNRPMVVPDSSAIEIEVVDSSKHPLFVVDGQDHHHLKKGDRVTIRKAPRRLRFIHLPDYNYFDLLSRKLHWRASNI